MNENPELYKLELYKRNFINNPSDVFTASRRRPPCREPRGRGAGGVASPHPIPRHPLTTPTPTQG